jgi:hypothetical protein
MREFFMRRLVSVLSVLALALIAIPAVAGSANYDNRVKSNLDEAGLKYEIDQDNDFKLLMSVGDGRTQIVYVNSATETWDNIEIREVWGPAFPSKGSMFPKKVANMLLADSQNKKLGAWQAYPQSKGYYAVFNVKIGAESDAGSLKSIINYVAAAADQMEWNVTRRDEY